MAVICAYSSILPYRGRSAPSLMVSVRLGTVGAALGSRGRSANSRAGVLVRAAYSPSLRGGRGPRAPSRPPRPAGRPPLPPLPPRLSRGGRALGLVLEINTYGGLCLAMDSLFTPSISLMAEWMMRRS